MKIKITDTEKEYRDSSQESSQECRTVRKSSVNTRNFFKKQCKTHEETTTLIFPRQLIRSRFTWLVVTFSLLTGLPYDTSRSSKFIWGQNYIQWYSSYVIQGSWTQHQYNSDAKSIHISINLKLSIHYIYTKQLLCIWFFFNINNNKKIT